MAKSKNVKPTKRAFIRRQIIADANISDDQILQNWMAFHTSTLTLKTIRRERTLFAKAAQYDEGKGLIQFYSSQAELLLKQYQNIEQLLGPAVSDWTWPGEHCETLLREAIQRTLPPSLQVGKGYVYGTRKTNGGVERSPEIDLLIYDVNQFAPIFSMGQFVIVRAESVRAVIQVKRTLDASTLKKAVENVVMAKQHVIATSQLHSSVVTEKLFSAVVSFDETIQQKKSALSSTYESVLLPHISEFSHGYILPDFIGSLNGIFLHFAGMNTNHMLYQAYDSVQDGNNVALPFLLYMLAWKIRPHGYHNLPAIPKNMPLVGHVSLWKNPALAKDSSYESTEK